MIICTCSSPTKKLLISIYFCYMGWLMSTVAIFNPLCKLLLSREIFIIKLADVLRV